MKKLLILLLTFSFNSSFAQMRDMEMGQTTASIVRPKFVSYPQDYKDIKTTKAVIAPDTTKHVAYFSPSISWTPGAPVSYSFEAGSWGLASNTSYGATFDVVPYDGKVDYWLGAKLYYTLHSEPTLSYFLYIAPKTNINRREGLLEFGFNPNYTLSKHLLLGVTLGEQVYAGGNNTVFGSLGLVYLFSKN
jgi:hypothetical protein